MWTEADEKRADGGDGADGNREGAAGISQKSGANEVKRNCPCIGVPGRSLTWESDLKWTEPTANPEATQAMAGDKKDPSLVNVGTTLDLSGSLSNPTANAAARPSRHIASLRCCARS